MRDHMMGYAPAADFADNVAEADYFGFSTDDYPLGIPKRIEQEYLQRRGADFRAWLEANETLRKFERGVSPYPDGTVPPPASVERAMKRISAAMVLPAEAPEGYTVTTIPEPVGGVIAATPWSFREARPMSLAEFAKANPGAVIGGASLPMAEPRPWRFADTQAKVIEAYREAREKREAEAEIAKAYARASTFIGCGG